MARGLRAAGHAVTVVCARSPGNARCREDGIEVIPVAWIDVEAHARRVGIDFRDSTTQRESGGPPRAGLMREIAVRLTIPDRYAVWVPRAVLAAVRAGRDCGILISTGPVSAHLVARAVHAGRPWIADFNDQWSLDPHRTNGSLRDAADVVLEITTIRRAVHLTTANDVYRDELGRRHRKPVTTLHSGFDPRDFQVSPTVADGIRPVELLCVGTLYADQNLGSLLRALSKGRRGGWLTQEMLTVRFVGRLTDRAALEAKRHGVAELVRTSDAIPRHELIARMMLADALLLLDHELEPNALPMRLFEYIGARRPILVLGSEHNLIARIVNEHGLGRVLPDSRELESVLRALVDHRDTLPKPHPQTRERFSSIETMRTLASIVASL
jgi:hypothetical protein